MAGKPDKVFSLLNWCGVINAIPVVFVPMGAEKEIR